MIYESNNHKINDKPSKPLYIITEKQDILFKCIYIPKDKQSQFNNEKYIFKIIEI